MASDTQPAVAQLRERFEALKRQGLQDVKLWYVGVGLVNVSVDDLCAEVNTLFGCIENGAFIDISAKYDKKAGAAGRVVVRNRRKLMQRLSTLQFVADRNREDGMQTSSTCPPLTTGKKTSTPKKKGGRHNR